MAVKISPGYVNNYNYAGQGGVVWLLTGPIKPSCRSPANTAELVTWSRNIARLPRPATFRNPPRRPRMQFAEHTWVLEPGLIWQLLHHHLMCLVAGPRSHSTSHSIAVRGQDQSRKLMNQPPFGQQQKSDICQTLSLSWSLPTVSMSR